MKNPINLKLTFSLALLVLLTFCADDDPIQYQLETLCIPEETGTVSPLPGMYNEGTEIELKATPIDEYIFKNWTGDASGNANPLKVIMLEDKNITAVFEKINYSLTIDIVGEGTVNQEIVLAKSSSKDYESGSTVQLTALADNHWKFVEWSGDHTGTENPIQLTMDQAMNITAKFEKISYALAIEVEGNGAVKEEIIQAKSTTDYDSGSKVQLTAEPEEGWVFDTWAGDHEGTENPLILTIDNDMSIKAIFEPENLEKTYVPDDNFEQALIDLGLDTKLDDYVYTARIKNVEDLQLEDRQIKDLKGIEAFGNLKNLNVANNSLENIDLSKNPWLTSLACDNNQLTSLDISANLGLSSLFAMNNQFSCIGIGPIQLWSVILWHFVDEGVILSVDCSVSDEDRTYIPDDAFEQALIDLGLDDVMDNYIKTIVITNRIKLDLSGKNISDLTGIEDFKAPREIDISNNNLSSLNISDWGFFTNLDIRNNPLTCIQANEDQIASLGFVLIWWDQGTVISLDCGN